MQDRLHQPYRLRLFLFEWRMALISLLTIPISLVATLLVLPADAFLRAGQWGGSGRPMPVK